MRKYSPKKLPLDDHLRVRTSLRRFTQHHQTVYDNRPTPIGSSLSQHLSYNKAASASPAAPNMPGKAVSIAPLPLDEPAAADPVTELPPPAPPATPPVAPVSPLELVAELV